jgi:hypothetical protein
MLCYVAVLKLEFLFCIIINMILHMALIHTIHAYIIHV